MAERFTRVQVWLVGDSRRSAAETGIVFDTFQSANLYAGDNALNVYTTEALIDIENLIDADDDNYPEDSNG